jgi:hypothetical protein
MRILPILFLFFILEALCALLWFAGTFGMAAMTFMLLGGDPDGSLALFWTSLVVWGVLFALPAILQMVQSAVWTRGLSASHEDIKKWSRSSSTEHSEPVIPGSE